MKKRKLLFALGTAVLMCPTIAKAQYPQLTEEAKQATRK